jgi:hypothetical protein
MKDSIHRVAAVLSLLLTLVADHIAAVAAAAAD